MQLEHEKNYVSSVPCWHLGNLENNLEALDPTESHPVAYFSQRTHGPDCSELASNSVSAQKHIFTHYSGKHFRNY